MANTDIRPLFGTLPTFQLNACTIEVPDDDRLIVAFAADLPEFLNRAAKIAIEVYCAIPDEVYEQVGQVGDPRDMYRGAVEDMLTRRDVVTRRFGAILAAFAYETPEFLPIQRPPASGALINVAKLVKVASWIRSALLLGAERFIAGHEFGYVATRVSGEPLESFQAKVRDVPFRAVRYSQRSEVEADVIGFMLNLYHAGRAYRPPAFPPSVTRLMEEFDTAGASFYFQAAEAFSNAHAKVNGRQSEMEDIHPSWEFRRQQLREVHRGYRGGDNLHAMMLEVILETLERRAAAMIEPMNALRLAWEEKLSGTEWQMKLD